MTKISEDVLRDIIAKNVALELKDNSYVNLGVGIPTRVATFVRPEQNIILQAENGMLGTEKDIDEPVAGEHDPDIISSSGFPATHIVGAAFFDSSLSFGMIRGGHIDTTVLGAMQVSEKGDIANYEIPEKMVVGMGGAMDLCAGAKEIIVATLHSNRGKPKILKSCTIPVTALHAVKKIVTEKALIEVTAEGLVLKAYNPMFSVEEIIRETEAPLIIDKDLKKMVI